MTNKQLEKELTAAKKQIHALQKELEQTGHGVVAIEKERLSELQEKNRQLQAEIQVSRKAQARLNKTVAELQKSRRAALNLLEDLEEETRQRRQSEQNLAEAEANLRSLINTRQESIWSVDRQFCYLIFNEKFATDYRTAYKTTLKKGLNALEILTPDLRAFWQPKYEQALSGKRRVFEFSETFPGGLRFFEVVLNPIRAGKEIIGVSAISSDITERKQNELLLKQTKETAERYLNIAAEIILALDKTGRITILNESGHKLLGYKKDELIGKNWFESCLPKNERAKTTSVFDQLMQGRVKNVTTYENPVITKSGAERIILWHNALLKDEHGKIIGTLSSGEDITERRYAEAALRESEQLFRSAFYTSPDSININRLEDGLYVEINRGFTEITGYTAEDVAGKTSAEINMWANPADRQRLVEGLKKHGHVKNLEAAFRTKDGGTVTGLMSAAVIMLGGVPHILSITRNIEHIKQTELALRESEERYRYLFENSPVALWEEDLTEMFGYLQTLLKKRVKKQNLKTFLNHHPEEVAELLKRIRILDVNRATLRLHQAKSKRQLKENLEQLFTEDSYAIFMGELYAMAAGKNSYEGEERVKTMDGQIKNIYLRFALKRPQAGSEQKYTGLIATTDITDLKQAEQEIRRSQARLTVLHQLDGAILEARSVAEISHAALENLRQLIPAKRVSIAVFDEEKDEALVYSRGLLEKEIGRAQMVPLKDAFFDLPGLRAGRVVRVDDIEKLSYSNGLLARLKESGIRSVLNIPIRAQGTLLGSLNLGFEQPRGFSEDDIGIGEEVADSVAIAMEQTRLYEEVETHARELEQSLEELRQINRLSLRMRSAKNVDEVAEETINMLRSAVNPDLILFYLCQEEKLELLAYDAGATNFKVSDAQHHLMAECLCGLTVQTRQPVFSRNIHKDKRCTLNECKNTGLTSFAGLPLLAGDKVIGMIGLGALQKRDFSEKKTFLETLMNETAVGLQNALLLEKLRRHEAELEQRVVRRTAELETANKELESFSYSVSHDLRAPLRAIDGFSRILEEDFAAKLDDEARRLISVVRANTQRMGQLIDDLLDFSRVSRKSLSLSQVDMANLADSIYHELTDAAQRKKIRFQVQKLPPARADASLIRQVLYNLLANALKFSSGRKTHEIEVGFKIEKGQTVYYIRDNGVGFEMKYADKLFQIFQRLHSSEEFPGTGIGLSIVRRIIKHHGGRVWAKAEEGKGATFYFTLPGDRIEEK